MPAHKHPGPQCTTKTGNPCNPSNSVCVHDNCLWGGRLLSCEKGTDGQFSCFHAEYYMGKDVLPDPPQPSVAVPESGLKGVPSPNALGNDNLFKMGSSPVTPDFLDFNPVRTQAVALVENFLRRPGRGRFPLISREDVALDLRPRIQDSGWVDQRKTALCGPASFIYSWGDSNVLNYVRYVIGLYEYGEASIGHLTIKPSQGFMLDPVPDGMSAADWIALGSLRDSENYFLEYHVSTFPVEMIASKIEGSRGDTPPSHIVNWFKKAGYTKVENTTLSIHEQQTMCSTLGFGGDGDQVGLFSQNVARANDYFRNGYKVILMICSNMLYADRMTTHGDRDHWVVMTSPILISDPTNVTFTVYTYGNRTYQVPNIQGAKAGSPSKLTLRQFLSNYYGFVAARG